MPDNQDRRQQWPFLRIPIVSGKPGRCPIIPDFVRGDRTNERNWNCGDRPTGQQRRHRECPGVADRREGRTCRAHSDDIGLCGWYPPGDRRCAGAQAEVTEALVFIRKEMFDFIGCVHYPFSHRHHTAVHEHPVTALSRTFIRGQAHHYFNDDERRNRIWQRRVR